MLCSIDDPQRLDQFFELGQHSMHVCMWLIKTKIMQIIAICPVGGGVVVTFCCGASSASRAAIHNQNLKEKCFLASLSADHNALCCGRASFSVNRDALRCGRASLSADQNALRIGRASIWNKDNNKEGLTFWLSTPRFFLHCYIDICH